MKKVWILLVVMVLAVLGAAEADEFSVRGVQFGMTLDEVQTAEGAKGRVLNSRSGTKAVYMPSELEGVEIGRAGSDVLTYKFHFGRLYEIQFWSGYYESEAEARNAFDAWDAMIQTRYGDCIDDAEPAADTACLSFYKDFYEDFDSRCIRSHKIGLTVEGQRIIADLFILPSVDDFQTFCAFDLPANEPSGIFNQK